jgi:dephospho-CoA kinase
MLKVGLTGGIGSGKSTVARIFGDLGARVIDADVVARDLVRPGYPLLAQIAEAFGPEVLLPDGELDRARLASIIFADAEKRRALEAILHPPIMREIDLLATAFGRAERDAVVVVEAALIVEIGRAGEFDRLVVVWATPEQQLQRLMARDGFGREEAERRLAAQMPLEEKRRAAHLVVDNSGTPADCRTDALRVFAELRRLALARK